MPMSVDQSAAFVKQQKVTRDQFLGGRLTIAQPGSGFRAGTDSVLLGAAIDAGSLHLLDLGSGVGTAALCALGFHRGPNALLAEIDPATQTLADANIETNGFASRARSVQADVTAPGAQREAAGLLPDSFTSVIANPPYFAQGEGTLAGESSRADARHMPAALLDRWVKTATACATPRGEVIFVHRIEALPALLAAFEARLGKITILPIAARPGENPGRVLIRGIKGSRAPLNMRPPLVLHEAGGNHYRAGVKAILMGETTLDW